MFFLIGPQEQTWTQRETFGMRFIVMLVEDVEQWKHWGRQADGGRDGEVSRDWRFEAETVSGKVTGAGTGHRDTRVNR